MTSTISNPMEVVSFPASQRTKQTELVRGSEQGLLAWLTPLVRRQSVVLDLGAVRRIDAAGVSALLLLYSSARRAGHRFAVTHPAPHVAEVLALVGLKRILLLPSTVWKGHSGSLGQSAAA